MDRKTMRERVGLHEVGNRSTVTETTQKLHFNHLHHRPTRSQKTILSNNDALQSVCKIGSLHFVLGSNRGAWVFTFPPPAAISSHFSSVLPQFSYPLAFLFFAAIADLM